jgi:arylsulfatase
MAKSIGDNAARPNILLIVTDQQRADALGIAGHPVLQTPFLDEIAASGIRFTNAYSACPVCVPARRTLMTGAKAAHHGVTMNYDTHLDLPTLPGELTRAGFHTHLCGKLHLYPSRKLHGFMSADWADSPTQWHIGRFRNDYQRFLIEHGVFGPDMASAGGMTANGWAARPFHMDERFHFTTWTVEMALRFLERRDATVPFFLKVSIYAPHQPFVPPAYYFDKYMQMDLPDEPPVGDWARVYDGPQRGLSVNAWRISLEKDQQRRMMAGYFGSIEHIDNQIGRLLKHIPRNTAIMFVSDHGEMLGDHQWTRKRTPYEGSSKIPFVLRLPPGASAKQGRTIDKPVELMDVMPTLLDIAGVECPHTVDGQSVMDLVRDEGTPWRDYIHGECSKIVTMNSGVQFITTGKHKYIYYPGPGIEQFFDLENDPKEMVNLIDDPAWQSSIAHYRDILIRELDGRSEGFVKDGKLTVTGGYTASCQPGFEREGAPDENAPVNQLVDIDR